MAKDRLKALVIGTTIKAAGSQEAQSKIDYTYHAKATKSLNHRTS